MRERLKLVKRLLAMSVLVLGINSACELASWNPIYSVRRRTSNQAAFLATGQSIDIYAYCGYSGQTYTPELADIYPGERSMSTSLIGNVGLAQIIQRAPAESGGLGITVNLISPGVHQITGELRSPNGKLSRKAIATFNC